MDPPPPSLAPHRRIIQEAIDFADHALKKSDAPLVSGLGPAPVAAAPLQKPIAPHLRIIQEAIDAANAPLTVPDTPPVSGQSSSINASELELPSPTSP